MGMANVSPMTQKSYVSAARTLYAKGDLPSCTKGWIEDNICLNPGLKPASKKNYILALRRFYSWLIECGVRRDNPARLVKVPRVKNGKPRYLKEQDIQRIFNAVHGTRNRLIIHFLYYTGLRAKELLALSKGDIDLENRIVVVVSGKGDKYREVPFPELMVGLIKAYYKKYNITDHMFYSSQDRTTPMTYEGLKCIFRHLGNRLGIHITAHRFRHSFATHLYNKGCDADTLQAFMGHSDFSVTKKYLFVMASTRRKTYDKCDLSQIVC
jgi:site-specific recombinase XerD